MIFNKLLAALVILFGGSFVSAGYGNDAYAEQGMREMSEATYASAENETQVKEVQKALNERGYAVDVDGVMGTETSNALHNFQMENGLKPEHSLNEETLAALGLMNGTDATWENPERSRRPASVSDTTFFYFEPEQDEQGSSYGKEYQRSAIDFGRGIPKTSLEKQNPESLRK